MNLRLLLTALPLVTTAAIAADLASIPAAPIAQKKELLFADDFAGATPAKPWHRVVPTFTFEQGALKGTQTRDKTLPATNGQAAVTAHAAVHGLEIPTRDSVVELRFRLEGATFVSVEYVDRQFTGAHYGHLCYARVTPTSVILVDQKEGSMRNDIYALGKDPARKSERAKLLEGRSATFPVKLDVTQWHTLTVETVGEAMRASIDGKPVAYLKSPGIAHPTKSKLEFGCGGKDGWFDDLKVWNAGSAKP
jgi:hypothetical protein